MSMSRVSRSPPFLEIPAQRHEGCLAHRVELGVDGAEHIRMHVAATVRLLDRGLSRDFSTSQRVPRQAKKALSPKP